MSRRGFTLIELSIIITIIGLLVGGIMVGQSLIRAAELRAISSEYRGYVIAVNQFIHQYEALPGDMRKATTFWGSSPSCPGTAGTGTQTCDGDGNGIFEWNGSTSQYTEIFMFWQHLANADLIDSIYTGIAGSAGAYDANIGENTPKSSYSDGGWSVYVGGNVAASNTNLYEGNYKRILTLGSAVPGNSLSTGALLTPGDAWNIDSKLDDGKPGTGLVRTFESQGSATAGSGCGNAAASSSVALAQTTEYDLTNDSAACSLIFEIE